MMIRCRCSRNIRWKAIWAACSTRRYNNLVTLTLSGAQLLDVLEQQWLNQPRARILQISSGFSYQWDASKPPGQRIVAGSVRLDGRPVVPAANYRITVNSFLAGGGDNFALFKLGHEARTGIMDVDAFEQFLAGNPTFEAAMSERIKRLN